MRIANCSGFFGDRLSAAAEMVSPGAGSPPIDVLTGDWLAELTMLILHHQQQRNPDMGYAHTFLTQMEQVLGTCLDQGIKVVTNAGGLNPAGCAARLHTIARRLGLDVRISYLEGDNLLPRMAELGHQMRHLDSGASLTAIPITANAYLGGWGIAAALNRGADVVICPRVTDASLVVGPAAWWWGWDLTDWGPLAGAVAAGHVIECGTQATGGNYSFYHEIPDRSRPLGFPIAEIRHDGSSIMTKHADTGGIVNVGTVTAQLLYEIDGPRYLNPDVVSHFDTIRLSQLGADRVEIHPVIGSPPPRTTKVCVNIDGGFRNQATFMMVGAGQADKAAWATQALFQRLGGVEQFDEVAIRLVEAPSDAAQQEAATGRLHITVKSSDERLVGRSFRSAVTELALANYPGFFVGSPPSDARPFGIFWPALIANELVYPLVVHHDGSTEPVDRYHPSAGDDRTPVDRTPVDRPVELPVVAAGPLIGETLGTYFGARSGDKGGNANLGVWSADDAGYAWLEQNLSVDAVRRLLGDVGQLDIRRYLLPSLRAINLVIIGYLGEGVASTTAFDAQAKGLGEFFRSRAWSLGDRPVD